MVCRQGKKSGIDIFADIVSHLFVLIVFIVMLYPLIYIVSASMSEAKYVNSGQMWLLPKEFTLNGYVRMMENSDIWLGYGNTLFYTAGGTLISLSATLLCGYALSRDDLVGRKLITILIMVTMFFNGGLIPTYLVINRLGLLNTRWIMLIAGAANAYNIIICRTFFATSIPGVLRESATIDGCSNWKLFMKIILPLSKPVIVVMILYISVTRWNWYFWPMILLSSRKLYPLQLILKEILIESEMAGTTFSAGTSLVELGEQANVAQMVKYCSIIASSLPLIIIYPFFQKYFEKWIMVGAVKG